MIDQFFTSDPMVDSYNCRATELTYEDGSNIMASTLIAVHDATSKEAENQADILAWRLELCHILATRQDVSTALIESIIVQLTGALPPRSKLRDRLAAFI